MRTYADICGRMRKHADAYVAAADARRSTPGSHLTYAGVRGRMRTDGFVSIYAATPRMVLTRPLVC